MKIKLEKERTLLANERTMLAYIRTALAALILGLGIFQFSQNRSLILIGILSIIISIIFIIIGIQTYTSRKKRIKNHFDD